MWISISVHLEAILKVVNGDIFRVPSRIKDVIEQQETAYIKKPYETRPYYNYIWPTTRWRQTVPGDF